jgi:ribosomal protein L19
MRGAVRRAKLYYLRERSGRAARVAEDVRQKTEETAGKG